MAFQHPKYEDMDFMKAKSSRKPRLVMVVPVTIISLPCALLLFIFVLLPLFAPFGSVGVPASCTDQASHLPSNRQYLVPGVGTGTLLVENTNIAIIVFADYGQSPFYTHVYIVNRHINRVANVFDFPTNVIDAGFDDNTLYLFNDTLGYFVSALNGKSMSFIVTSDNYRGLYESNRVQSDLTISGITTNHTLMFRHYIHMSNIVRGCYLS
jgi:hypothetical protein